MSNTSLNKSKAAKNDEYYTRLEDIEKELVYYSPYLKGKKVVCNCDSEASMFWTYLTTNYDSLGLKGLTATHSPTDYPTYSNYPAINVNKVKDIPSDYKGLMGVPVNFLTKHCSSQFRIVDRLNNPKLGERTIYKRVIIERI
jgi:modification methylase (adenine-specificmethyltransferase)|nr:MAG TPA: adenine-specific methyltransferase [Caudoviricetes sp.]